MAHSPRRLLIRLFACLFAAALALPMPGCAKDVSERYYLEHPYPPSEIEDVQVLATPPMRSYRVIAEFRAEHRSPAEMRQRAADIGGHAVIVQTRRDHGGWDGRWAELPDASIDEPLGELKATVIRFR